MKMKKGDQILWHNYPNLKITVRRVAKDQSWADIFVYDLQTLTSWTKRQPLPIREEHRVLS